MSVEQDASQQAGGGQAERLQPEGPQGERHRSERHQAEQLQAERLQPEGPQGERHRSERHQAERLQAEQLRAERPEAERLRAERPEAERPGDASADSQLDAEIVEAFGEILEQMIQRVEAVARRFELPSFCLKALHMLNAPMAMKELGQRIHCDPSFVTAIADMLDAHGLGLREPDTRDRRVKHLRLTAKGFELRERVERELFARLPWTEALEVSEREELLRLLRKMLAAGRGQRAPCGETAWRG